ncbi:MAG: putative heme transporter [Pseudonocardiales bacterium]|nr:putative heme transporter [Pseudonocardiales bacterium]
MTTNPALLAPAPPLRRKWLRPVLSAAVSLALVIGIFWYFIPQFTSMSDVWSEIQSMTWLEMTTLAVAAVWNLATYLFVMVGTTPGLKYRQAFVATESSTAVSNTIPGGGAIGIGLVYSMFGSWGFSRSRTSVSLVVAGLWNNFVKLGMPVLALSLLALQGKPSTGRIIAAAIGLGALIAAVVALTALLRSEASARKVGLFAAAVATRLLRLAGRPPVHGWELATVKFRGRTEALVKARWLWITLATVVSHLSLFLVLLLALRHIGVSNADVSWIEALAVFSFARLITAVPITPGGLGVVEVALITGLSAAGGARSEVTAAVLLFRALTYVVPIPLGLATYLSYKRNRSWRREPGTAPRSALVRESA